ncbi:tyrosine protein kinase transmembrane receptor [Echinococcus multilocularis]|uniref:Tyrosine protein kinase transmembrane receptor n=1 Tax=Echinococcus multilocularis TaxID=6211 RepID=A0A068XXR1_ECHMU|nr:tyrosine protein kinase transmembrane receptor [Echinococcus multilocularis]
MNHKVLVFVYFSLIALGGASKIVHSVKVNDTVTLDPCPIPEVVGSVKSRWEWYRDNDLVTADSSPFLKLHEHNGSLTITARMADVNHAYGCRGFAILPNGTEIFGHLMPYVISPIIPAFLEHDLRNITVARNEQYEIPCKAGGIKSTLEIKVNGGNWPWKRIRIFNDTVIECRVFNSAGEEKASAYLSVEPGVKEKTHLNHLSDWSACQPFMLSAPSVCSGILEAEGSAGSVYTISTSRLLLAESTNRILASTFRKWDSLVPPNAPPASPHLRCLQQAKRLVCLLVFPRCLEIEAYIEDFNSFDVDPDKRFLSSREFPVCQQHCFLITALICAASFNTSHESAALWDYKPNATQGEGWRELLARGGNISQILPDDGCTGLSRMMTTNSPTSFRENVGGHFRDASTSACQSLSFAALSPRRDATPSASQNCYSGYGVDYRGTAPAPTSCLPWVELDYVKSDSPDPLTSLSPSIIPREALEPLPSNYSVCRNPLGLAPKPFCVGSSRSTPGILTLFNCSYLVDCAFANSTPPGNHVNLLRRQQRINMISITATMCTFFFLLIFLALAYILRACRQEKARVSVEEERENRRAQLVARRVRLRETNCSGRCLLCCFYTLQDACGKKDGGGQWACCRHCCCCIETHEKIDPTKAGAETALEKAPDDEDEEVQHLVEFLRQNHLHEQPSAVGVLSHTDNQPHLTPLGVLSEAIGSAEHADADTASHPPISYLQPNEPSSTAASIVLCRHGLHHTHCLAGANVARVHLDSAFMLVSAGQFMHPKLKQLSYSRKLLIEERTLAKSAYGHVILARAPCFPLKRRFGLANSDLLEGLDVPESPYVVIKTLNFGATPAAETSFFREAELLIELDHPNIVRIIGICIPLQPYSLIYEYMRDGDLNTFLHHARDAAASPLTSATNELAFSVINDDDTGSDADKASAAFVANDEALPTPTLLRFALGVCEAMIYLSGKLYVHRDLATRNCLVNGSHVKLADFSMCRRLPHNCAADLVDTDSEAPLAVRWLPLESILQGHFNVDTDVWSFGVLLWELFTFGQMPYGNVEVSEVIRALTENRRLPRPVHCPPSIYRLMQKCWSPTREYRPSFREIKSSLLTNL